MAGPSGFFLGGTAEGIAAARKQELARDTFEADTALRERALGVTERAQRTNERNATLAEADKHVSATMSSISELAKAAREAGHSPERIAAAARPLLQDAVDIYAMTGRDPGPLLNRAEALIGMPAAPNSDIAKLQVDLRNGLITAEEFAAKKSKLTSSDAPVTNVNIGGEKKFAETVGEQSAKDFMARRTSALDAAKTIESTDEALRLLDSGTVVGIGADWIIGFGKGLQRIGINFGKDAISNTEAYFASRAKEVGTTIRLFGSGTGLSDNDRIYAEKAVAGQINLNEQSMRKILEINERAARNVIANYNREAAQVDPGIVPFDLRVSEPPPRAKAEDRPIRRTINGVTYEKIDGTWYAQ